MCPIGPKVSESRFILWTLGPIGPISPIRAYKPLKSHKLIKTIFEDYNISYHETYVSYHEMVVSYYETCCLKHTDTICDSYWHFFG